jgi:hypothetical protein
MIGALSRGPLRTYAVICFALAGYLAREWFLNRRALSSGRLVLINLDGLQYIALIFLLLGIGLTFRLWLVHGLFIIWSLVLGLAITLFLARLPSGWTTLFTKVTNYLQNVLLLLPLIIFVYVWRRSRSSTIHAT